MEECCAVCAEPLEWVAYGPCGHREVCSTCTARLRFVLNDKRCCICKQECPLVFVTKALGDYTKLVGDFESLTNQINVVKEDGVLWFESNTQAFFDDEEHFKLIKAMCRLYCSVCEQAEEHGKDFVKKGYVFRNLDFLRRHLVHVHKLQMCELCLEGRKVFLCEQKLYTKAQLDRHASKGDSLVDGNEEERGGFSGHPMCDFCRRRFYGDNEIYQHMSTEHYTCHICQRSRPGRHDYYRNYDDLEAHFRYEHSLCEHPECLAKKFVVFISDTELKRHNALIHGGNMSRAQRNAALQIPVSFQYRRPRNDHGGDSSSRRVGRGHGNHPDDQLSASMHANSENSIQESLGSETNSTSNSSNTSGRDFPMLSGPAASLGSSISEASFISSSAPATETSRYLEAVSRSTPASLEESAFPPLPGSKNARRKAKQRSRGPAMSMAALLGGHQDEIKVLHSPDFSQPRGRGDRPSTSEATESVTISQSVENLIHVNPLENPEKNKQSISAVSGPGSLPVAGQGAAGGAIGFLGEVSSAVQEDFGNGSSVAQLSIEEIRIANRALVEHIRAGLRGDELQFTAFKDVSLQFRKGEINAKIYYKNIESFGLSHLVPELARLCPDPNKQKELLDAYQEGLIHKHSEAAKTPHAIMEIGSTSNENRAQKGKHSVEMDTTVSSSLSSANLQSRTESGGSFFDGEVEELSKDGYRDTKGKTKPSNSSSSKSASGISNSSTDEGRGPHSKLAQVLVRATQPLEAPFSSSEPVMQIRMDRTWACSSCTLENKAGTSHCVACGTGFSQEKPEKINDTSGSEKRKKRTSKFQRVRLGDGSVAALLDRRENSWGIDRPEDGTEGFSPAPPGGQSSGRGVWRNGGGQKLVSIVQNNP